MLVFTWQVFDFPLKLCFSAVQMKAKKRAKRSRSCKAGPLEQQPLSVCVCVCACVRERVMVWRASRCIKPMYFC